MDSQYFFGMVNTLCSYVNLGGDKDQIQKSAKTLLLLLEEKRELFLGNEVIEYFSDSLEVLQNKNMDERRIKEIYYNSVRFIPSVLSEITRNQISNF